MPLARSVKTVAEVGAIGVIPPPSQEEFERNYLSTGTPVIIRGALGSWPAASKWTLDYLGSTLGHKQVTVCSSDDGVFRLNSEASLRTTELTFREYLSKITEARREGARLYISQAPIQEQFPELMPDIELPPLIAPSLVQEINFWFGPAGNVTPLHFDSLNNFLAQVSGRKKLVLFDPTQYDHLYPSGYGRTEHTSLVDIDHPDFQRFPALRQASRLECVLESGDMLFLPPAWWHQVYSLDLSISVNFWWKPRISQCLVPGLLLGYPLLLQLANDPRRWTELAQRHDPAESATLIEVCEGLLQVKAQHWEVVLLGGAALTAHLQKLSLWKGAPAPPVVGPRELQQMNESLETVGAYDHPTGERVSHWLRLAQKARRGKSATFASSEVAGMIEGVRQLIDSTAFATREGARA